MRLPSWFELSNRRISSTAVLIDLRLFDQALLLGGMIGQRHEAIADQIGRGLMPGVEQEDAIVQQLLFRQPLAVLFALDQPRQHIAFGIAGFCAPSRDQNLEIGEKVLHGLVAARKNFRADHGLQRAQNRQRPVAQRLAFLMRHVEQIADHLDRYCGGEIADQLDLAFCGEVARAGDPPRRPDTAPSPRSRAATARP